MKHIHSDDEYKSLSKSGKMVLKFGTTWCGPCKKIAPYFEELSSEYTGILFASLDAEECEKTSESLKITALPTFVILDNGKEVDRIAGADKKKLKNSLEKISEN